MLTVVKSKRPGQQNHVYDAETRWSGNPGVMASVNKDDNAQFLRNCCVQATVSYTVDNFPLPG